MKNIIKNTRDIQVGENRVFLRLPMKYILKEKIKSTIEWKKEVEEFADKGNIPAMLSLIIMNQWMIWNKLKEK